MFSQVSIEGLSDQKRFRFCPSHVEVRAVLLPPDDGGGLASGRRAGQLEVGAEDAGEVDRVQVGRPGVRREGVLQI